MMNLARNAEPQDYAEQPPSMSSETTSKRAYRYALNSSCYQNNKYDKLSNDINDTIKYNVNIRGL